MRIDELQLGDAWSEAFAADMAEIAMKRDAADAKMFDRSLRPTTPDAIASYTWLTSRLTAAGYGDRLAELHGRALVDNRPLADLLRGVEAIEDVAAATARTAAPTSELEPAHAAHARAAAIAVERYKLSIASQIAAVAGHEHAPAAHEYLAAVALGERIAAARQRHEAHAQLELDRIADEDRAAREAVAAESQRLVDAAEATARDTAAAAARAANDLRLVKADQLAVRLRARLELASRTKDHELTYLRSSLELHSVAGILGEVRAYSVETLARFTAMLDRSES